MNSEHVFSKHLKKSGYGESQTIWSQNIVTKSTHILLMQSLNIVDAFCRKKNINFDPTAEYVDFPNPVKII